MNRFPALKSVKLRGNPVFEGSFGGRLPNLRTGHFIDDLDLTVENCQVQLIGRLAKTNVLNGSTVGNPSLVLYYCWEMI
jgi:hypothetical protein